jgi:hypothetical protein
MLLYLASLALPPFRVSLFLLDSHIMLSMMQVLLSHMLDVYLRHGQVPEGPGCRGAQISQQL